LPNAFDRAPEWQGGSLAAGRRARRPDDACSDRDKAGIAPREARTGPSATTQAGRGTAFSYKNKQIDLKTLGKELSIRWAVQGAVRRSGDQVRNVSLADIPTGQAIWSDRFDGDRTNLVAMQDQINARLARSLNIELIQAEAAALARTKIQMP
jgi:hypothetical protein